MLKAVIDAAQPLVVTLIGLLFAWLANEIRAKVHSTRVQGVLLRLADLSETVTKGGKEALGVFGYRSTDELESLIGSKIESALVQTKQLTSPVLEVAPAAKPGS